LRPVSVLIALDLLGVRATREGDFGGAWRGKFARSCTESVYAALKVQVR
jgi:hypothetical protein